MKAPLYLGGQRFEVVHALRGYIKGLPEISLSGEVLISPKCDLEKLHTLSGPVKVKYRGMSGPFWLDASSSGSSMTIHAVPAGPVKWAK